MLDRKILLFDIDGTLIRCGGAGGKSLCAALAVEYGLSEVRPVELHGRTDLGILNELLTNHEIEANQVNRDRLCHRYYELLPSQLQVLADSSKAHVLPGVEQLLINLSASSDYVVAILTGNMPTSARIKLEHFRLWRFFEFGIFGNLTDHRPALAEPAKLVIDNHCGSPVAADQVVIIGDTPLDIELAQRMGARSIAVCTGGCSSQQLHEAGAEIVLDDLSDTFRVIQWLDSPSDNATLPN